MIELSELNPHNFPTTPEIDANLNILLTRLNGVRKAYNVPMIVDSGLRSEELQSQLIAQGRSKATQSKHLYGQAADIADSNRDLWAWLMQNLNLLEDLGLWLEDKASTPKWVHFQIVPPGSGHRIFIP